MVGSLARDGWRGAAGLPMLRLHARLGTRGWDGKAGGTEMQPGWVRWIAYILLASLVVVTSCQAMAGPAPSVLAAAGF